MESNYSNEIKALETVYSEIIEAIVNKPESADYEVSRIYFENVAARMNKWAAIVNSVKGNLENRAPIGDLTADNRPA